MNLVKISKNVLVNPKYISSVEQKDVRGKQTIIIWVDGRSYTLEVSLKEFMNELDNLQITDNKQYFAG